MRSIENKNNMEIIALISLISILLSLYNVSGYDQRDIKERTIIGCTDHGILEEVKNYHGDTQRILNLWGTHYERGYAHGYLLAEEIPEMFKYVLEINNIRDDSLYNQIKNQLLQKYYFKDKYNEELQGIYDGMVQRLKEINRLDLLHIPSLGRDMDLEDLKMHQLMLEILRYRGMTGSCSGLAIWGDYSKNGHTILAKSTDFMRGSEDQVCKYHLIVTVDPTENDEVKYFALNWPGFLGVFSAGVNRYGVFVSIIAGDERLPDNMPEGKYITSNIIYKEILEEIKSSSKSSFDNIKEIYEAKTLWPAQDLIALPSQGDSNNAIVIEDGSQIGPFIRWPESELHQKAYDAGITNDQFRIISVSSNYYLPETVPYGKGFVDPKMYNYIMEKFDNAKNEGRIDINKMYEVYREAHDEGNPYYNKDQGISGIAADLNDMEFLITQCYPRGSRGWDYQIEPIRYKWDDLFPNHIVISGRVTKDTGEGISGVNLDFCNLNFCDGTNVVTDSDGYWSIITNKGSPFCVSISSGLPEGYSNIKGVNNNNCHTDAETYEWQIAGENKFINCSYDDERSWDLDDDNKFDFVVEYQVQCTDTDGGKNYYEKGTVTDRYGEKYTDYCIDKKNLMEYYCNEDGTSGSESYECPYKCEDGACITKSPIPPYEGKLTCGESTHESEESAGVPHSVCRILPDTKEFNKYIIRCEIDSECVRFVKEDSHYMQEDTCRALKNVIKKVCDKKDKRALITIQTALDTGGTELPESPSVEGRGVRFYSDTGITNDELADIAAEEFDFVSNNCNHIYASVKGESPDPDDCSTIDITWTEASHTPASHMADDIISYGASSVINSGHNAEMGLLGKLRDAIKDSGIKHNIWHGFQHWVRKSLGGRSLAALFFKIAFLDQTELMCEKIDNFILLKPDLTKPIVVNAVDFFIHLIEPFYVLAIILTAFYLLFVSASPIGRARAKSTLLRLILSVGLIILTIPIMQLFLDLIHLLSVFTLSLIDVGIVKKFMCTECINSLTWYFIGITTIAFLSGLFIAMFQLIFYLGAFILLVLRFFMVILWTVFFPLTIFLHSFHFTRRLGTEMLYQTGWWILMQFVEAVILLGITLAVIHMPNELVHEQAFRIGMGLSSYLLIIIAPLFAMGMMDWIAMMIISFSALEVPWLSAAADMIEEAEIEEYEKEKISPPKPVGPPKGPPW